MSVPSTVATVFSPSIDLLPHPEGIPPLVAKYRRQLQFKPDKEPKFLFAPVGDIVQALTVFAKELMELVEEEGKSEK